MRKLRPLDRTTYQLAQAVLSSIYTAMLNAYEFRSDPEKSRRAERQADHLETKFINEFGHHPQTYIEVYENYERKCQEQGLHPD